MSTIYTVGLKEATASIWLSHWTLRKYIRSGLIRAVRIGRRVLLEPGALERLVAEGRQEVTSRPGKLRTFWLTLGTSPNRVLGAT